MSFLRAAISLGSFVFSSICAILSLCRKIFTSSSWATANTWPWVSNCGRPARPNIWWAPLAAISFFLPRGPFSSSVSTTLRAGRFMPAARVSVHTQKLSSFS